MRRMIGRLSPGSSPLIYTSLETRLANTGWGEAILSAPFGMRCESRRPCRRRGLGLDWDGLRGLPGRAPRRGSGIRNRRGKDDEALGP